ECLIKLSTLNSYGEQQRLMRADGLESCILAINSLINAFCEDRNHRRDTEAFVVLQYSCNGLQNLTSCNFVRQHSFICLVIIHMFLVVFFLYAHPPKSSRYEHSSHSFIFTWSNTVLGIMVLGKNDVKCN
ncbi:hypothetical protein Droror1_Dr00023412, partial [Drosera rotundifolia]